MNLLRQNLSGIQRRNLELVVAFLSTLDESLHIRDRIDAKRGEQLHVNVVGAILECMEEPWMNDSDAWFAYKRLSYGFECELMNRWQERIEELIGFYWVYLDGSNLIGVYKADERLGYTFKQWAEIFKQILT